jgi:hypothetical protein
MRKLVAGMAVLLVAGLAQQDNPLLNPPPPTNPSVDDPEIWKNKEFIFTEEGKNIPQDSKPADSLPPDGDRAWKHKDYLNAAVDYQRQANLTPGAPEPWYNAALAWRRQGWRAETLNALDKAEAAARGSLRQRCLLLRADLEYRDALPKEPFARIAGLGRALQMYRDVLASPDTDPRIARIAKYDIEVVKLRLLVHAAGSPPPNANSGTDPSPDDIAAAADPAPKQQHKPQEKSAQPKDW